MRDGGAFAAGEYGRKHPALRTDCGMANSKYASKDGVKTASSDGLGDRGIRYVKSSELATRRDPMLSRRQFSNGLPLTSVVGFVSYGYISPRGRKFAP